MNWTKNNKAKQCETYSAVKSFQWQCLNFKHCQTALYTSYAVKKLSKKIPFPYKFATDIFSSSNYSSSSTFQTSICERTELSGFLILYSYMSPLYASLSKTLPHSTLSQPSPWFYKSSYPSKCSLNVSAQDS